MTYAIRQSIIALLLLILFPGIGNAAEGYRLVCDEPVFDFGPVDQSAVITNVFVVRNEGDQTFPFKYLQSSCSCTKGRVSRRMIGPGETAEVRVIYTAAGRRGSQNKKIRLMPMHEPAPALSLTMKGFVDAP
jgi:hypothetical protein